MDASIDRSNIRKGKWGEGEDIILTRAIEMRVDKDWAAIAALVSGRTKQQCYGRWHNVLKPCEMSRKVNINPDFDPLGN
jgi:predicted benzoate:H+ symporter BenE